MIVRRANDADTPRVQLDMTRNAGACPLLPDGECKP